MRLSIAAAFSSLTLTAAQLARFTPPSDRSLSYSLNIPESTSSSGSGPLFFQIRGPSTGKSWIALGIGSSMTGAQIFVIYTDGAGNVTVSPRSGQGHFMPQVDRDLQVQLLSGSGIVGNNLIANVRCDNCIDAAGLSVTDTRSSWIWAAATGDPIDSTDVASSIVQHDTNGVLSFDLTTASGGNSNNPFVSSGSSSSPTGSRTSTGGPAPTQTGGSDNNVDPNNNAGGDENVGSGETGGALANLPRMLKIHGILMGLAFAVLFPLGAIVIRLMPGPHKADIHMVIQIVAFAIAIAGLAYGIMIAQDLQYLKEKHPVIGMVVMGGLFFQPIVGLIHHWLYKTRGQRTILAHLHTYWGRIMVILGIINGGLGLQLANNTQGGKIAYSVIAGVMGAIWLASAALYYVKGGSKANGAPITREKPVHDGVMEENYGVMEENEAIRSRT